MYDEESLIHEIGHDLQAKKKKKKKKKTGQNLYMHVCLGSPMSKSETLIGKKKTRADKEREV
jgi:hypothetical protein